MDELPKIVLRPYQEEMVGNTLELLSTGCRGALNVAPTASGKCHRRGSTVLMFDGDIKKVEDVVAGDLLMGPDSFPRMVNSITSGRGDIYRVTPKKGDYYDVNENHILSLKITRGATKYDGSKGSRYVAGTIINISVADYLKESKTFKNCAKGYRAAVNFEHKPVGLDPYYLGIWLGDGTSTRPQITTADDDVALFVKRYTQKVGLRLHIGGKSGNKASNYSSSTVTSKIKKSLHKNWMLEQLRSMNLINNKHIPKKYLCNSRSVRMAVLAGLMDTDGYLDGGCYDYVTKDYQLACDVVYLCRSLGFAAYMNVCNKTCVNNGVRGVYHRVSISGELHLVPVVVLRKKASERKMKKDVLMVGIDVKKICVDDYFGFDVSGDRLYLMGDFTVTHNSLTMAKTATQYIEQTDKSVLILAHMRELVKNNRKAVQMLGKDCYQFDGMERDINWHDFRKGSIVSASIQSMGPRTLAKAAKDSIGLVLIDEGHHAAKGSSYDEVIQHFGCQVALYTATPDRLDGKPLVGDKALCDKLAYNGQVKKFVSEGWILRPVVRNEWTKELDWSIIPNNASEVTKEQCEKVWMANEAHYAIIKPLLARYQGMPTIGFAPTVRLAKLWAGLVNDDLPAMAEYVASYKPLDYLATKESFDKQERVDIQERFERREIDFIFNQGIFLEGTDLVAAQLCFMAAYCKSRSNYAQKCGRVLRPCNTDNGRSILSGMELATAGQRLDKIKASRKPHAIIYDTTGKPGVLAHPADLFIYNSDVKDKEKVRERAIDYIDKEARKGRDVDVEEAIQLAEDSYKRFLVRDAAVRKSIAVDFEVISKEIDPYTGTSGETTKQRYMIKKSNPPPGRVVESIEKSLKYLGKSYSQQFWESLNARMAFAIDKQLKGKVRKIREGKPCPQWIVDKLASVGRYEKPKNEAHGIDCLVKFCPRKQGAT